MADEFPEYIELERILRLAAVTWPRWGLSAVDLSELDDWTLSMLKMTVDNPYG